MIWLASFPRSGNGFLRVILKYVYGIPSTSPYSPPESAPGGRFSMAASSNDDARRGPIFAKTHELRRAADSSPAIYLVRDGRDCYVSYSHFAPHAEPATYLGMSQSEVLDSLIEGDPFGGWSKHVETWTRRAAPTALVRFEELVADPVSATREALGRLGVALPPPSGPVPAFSELNEWDPVNFRDGKIGRWRDEMPAVVEEHFWTRHGSAMTRLGYRRDGSLQPAGGGNPSRPGLR